MRICEICGKTEDGRNTVTEIFGDFPPCPRCGKKTAGKENKMKQELYRLYRICRRANTRMTATRAHQQAKWWVEKIKDTHKIRLII